MSKINETLLKALFDDPRPQPDKEEVLQFYRELNIRIFPGRNNFISFLQAHTIDKQYEYAAKIIHSLCFYSNFPPDYFALVDILNVENYQRDTVDKKDLYIPRDHFLHIVNIYLLGIYIFFYNAEFYDRIILENRFEREDNTGFENIKRNCVKDFLSQWKYFCLFHDIGYSPEVLGNTKISSKNRKSILKKLKETGFQSSLSSAGILEHICFFDTIEILSRLIVASFVQNSAYDEITNSHKMFKTLRMSKLFGYYKQLKQFGPITFDKVSEHIKAGKRLEKVYDNQCLKILLPIFGVNPITVVGTHRETGQLIFLSYFDSTEAQRKIVTTEGHVGHPEIQKLAALPDLILFDEYISSEFELEYLLSEENDFKTIFQIINSDHLENIFEMAKAASFIGIGNGRQFLDFQYTVYMWLYEKLEPYLLNSPLSALLRQTDGRFNETRLKSGKESDIGFFTKKNQLIYRSLKGRHYEDIRDFCFECIEQQIKEKTDSVPKTSSKSTTLMLSDIVEQLFGCLKALVEDSSCKEDLKWKARHKHLTLLDQDSSLLNLYVDVYLGLKRTLGKTTISFSYDYAHPDPQTPSTSPFLWQCINDKAQQFFFGRNAEDIRHEYNLPYGNTVDHGIVSAQYAASIFEIYRNAIIQATDPQEQRLLSILLNMGGDISNSQHKYIENYNHVFTETLYAIFIHNLYPSQFLQTNQDDVTSNGKKCNLTEYKTTIKTPFSYLALLCDALQEWNRPHTLFPSRFENRPNEDTSSEFDIMVKNNTIFVYENGERTDQEHLAHNIRVLSQYLEEVDAFLKNGYVQTE